MDESARKSNKRGGVFECASESGVLSTLYGFREQHRSWGVLFHVRHVNGYERDSAL